MQLAQEESFIVFRWTKYENSNYLKVLEEAIEEMEDIRDISRDVLFLQIENARYLWSIENFEIYFENDINILIGHHILLT